MKPLGVLTHIHPSAEALLPIIKGSVVKHWYYETFAEPLVEIERGLYRFFKDRPQVTPLFWEMINHHFGWSGDLERLSPAQVLGGMNGKRSRPLLTLLVAKALTGDYQVALPAALGIEIVHNFTLVHDDVMDKSLERRHRPTLWAKWGSSQAVNTGDGLYSLGIESVCDSMTHGVAPDRTVEAIRLLTDACVATVEGQMLDIAFEQRMDVTSDEYITMIEHKSGILIACSTQMGALMAGASPAVQASYREFGRSIGIAFQIWDDYLGIWGEPSTTGKSASSDIESRKKSYPVLVAMERAQGGSRDKLRSIYQQEHVSAEDVTTVLHILDEVDAVAQTRQMLDVYFEEGLESLANTGLDNDLQDQIRQLSKFLVARDY
jgi:geranylgeranyl diphosphate synthase, type I